MALFWRKLGRSSPVLQSYPGKIDRKQDLHPSLPEEQSACDRLSHKSHCISFDSDPFLEQVKQLLSFTAGGKLEKFGRSIVLDTCIVTAGKVSALHVGQNQKLL